MPGILVFHYWKLEKIYQAFQNSYDSEKMRALTLIK